MSRYFCVNHGDFTTFHGFYIKSLAIFCQNFLEAQEPSFYRTVDEDRHISTKLIVTAFKLSQLLVIDKGFVFLIQTRLFSASRVVKINPLHEISRHTLIEEN